eukprot:5681247-Amphidinium_carterae.1
MCSLVGRKGCLTMIAVLCVKEQVALCFLWHARSTVDCLDTTRARPEKSRPGDNATQSSHLR